MPIRAIILLAALSLLLIRPLADSYAYAQDTGSSNAVADPEDLLLDVEDIGTTTTSAELDIDRSGFVEEGAEFSGAAGTSDNGNAVDKDIILVLDNSGSMKKNDPNFLTSRAVTEFIQGLDESTRIAIIIFDQNVSLAVPLTQVTLASRAGLLASLDDINYRGLYTDSPAAIERAIYELKNNGRDAARKVIIFMTDGIVDTGDANVDLEKSKWLKNSLAPDAADAGIKIFGIAFTEDADFQLIQSLAQTSEGEYYRALQPEDLDRVFGQINTIISRPSEPKVIEATIPAPSVPAASPQPVVIEVPTQPVTAMGEEERIRSMIIMVAVIILIIAMIGVLILLLRRNREIKGTAEEYPAEAYLNDIHGYTSKTSYKLGTKPTMMGRVTGKDAEHLNYIVIPETTIGRRHCLIEYKDYAYWIIDQGSINGTFVNGKPVTSEVRLKHGDKIRLHKLEFEFVMPEMVDAGMTVVSNTVMADQAPDFADEATEIKGGVEEESLDFDLSEGIAGEAAPYDTGTEADVAPDDFDSEDETLIPGHESEEATPPHGTEMNTNDQDLTEENEFDSEDETLMPGSDEPSPDVPKEEEFDSEDETLMPDQFNLPDEDATIRKELPEDDQSLDNFIDLGNLEDDKDK